MNIKYFSLFNCGLPHDAMHDIFEGIAPLEIKKLISYHNSANSFTLSEFNERLILPFLIALKIIENEDHWAFFAFEKNYRHNIFPCDNRK